MIDKIENPKSEKDLQKFLETVKHHINYEIIKKLIIKLAKLINVIIKGNDKYMNKKNLI